MDPNSIGPEQWETLSRGLAHLVLWVALMVNTALPFLLAHAIIPSLIVSGDIPEEFNAWRRFLYPISAVSLVLTLYSLGQGLTLLVGVLQQFYPRFAI